MAQKIKFGNILTISDGVIIHGCNAQGVMGSGIAGQIKEKYPECFKEYRKFCESTEDKREILGLVHAFSTENLVILNAITQFSFGKDGSKYVSYKAVRDAFKTISEMIDEAGINEINYPLIGAGLGGGDWTIISALIDEQFAKYPHVQRNLWVYEE